jgi:Rrf2 family transcriptional regulator, iron-sulfur cluster assembly transcription factor
MPLRHDSICAVLRYGKQARQAVAAISYIAQHHGLVDAKPLSSKQVAEARRITPVLAAKLMTEMARAGLLTGSPGPGGGYRLAREPAQITLDEVVRIFEKDGDSLCPFGPGWCGTGNPCPLHDDFEEIERHTHEFLCNTTLEGFAEREPTDGTVLPSRRRMR